MANPDLRGRVKFPPPPASVTDILNYARPPWLLACALVGKYDRGQVNTFRKLYAKLGDDALYREILNVTRIIFAESRTIVAPPAFLVHQFQLALAGEEVYR